VYDFLRGRISSSGPARAVLDVAGVGWLLHVPDGVSARLKTGAEATLLVHLAVGDTALTLYGFLTEMERRLFRRLIQVTGVGPTRALEVMSALPPETLVRAIVESDVPRLSSVKGVGKKTAERLVVELRDHLREWTTGASAQGAAGGADAIPSADDLVRVLTDLGAPPPAAQRAAERARKALGPEASFQDLLRHSLRNPA
jgi:Holliday junction DNA helicase RuvA